MARTLNLSVPARISALTEISEAIEQFCEEGEVPMATAFRVNLAVQELVTNSVTHGEYHDREPEITVTIEQDDKDIRITLEDNADEFDPFESAPPPDVEGSVSDRPIGGLGVHLVRNIFKKATHEHAGGKNRIHLASPLSS